MSFIILLITWLAYFVENNSDDIVIVKINELWINVAWSFFDFSSINSFWIVYKWETPVLIRLNLNNKSLNQLNLKVTSENINEIRNILLEFIEETPKIELKLSEKIIEKLKL